MTGKFQKNSSTACLSDTLQPRNVTKSERV
jgi:hypothetical protein